MKFSYSKPVHWNNGVQDILRFLDEISLLLLQLHVYIKHALKKGTTGILITVQETHCAHCPCNVLGNCFSHEFVLWMCGQTSIYTSFSWLSSFCMRLTRESACVSDLRPPTLHCIKRVLSSPSQNLRTHQILLCCYNTNMGRIPIILAARVVQFQTFAGPFLCVSAPTVTHNRLLFVPLPIAGSGLSLFSLFPWEFPSAPPSSSHYAHERITKLTNLRSAHTAWCVMEPLLWLALAAVVAGILLFFSIRRALRGGKERQGYFSRNCAWRFCSAY